MEQEPTDTSLRTQGFCYKEGYQGVTESTGKELVGLQESPATRRWFATGTKRIICRLWIHCLCPPQKLYDEALIPNMTVFGARTTKKMMKVKGDRKGQILI